MSERRMPDHEVAGDSDVTVFLLHGIYGSKRYWKYEIGRLVARGYRVVAWDAPGYGISPLPEPYSLQIVARAAADLIELHGTATNVIFGHSMGGQVTPRVYSMLPARISAIVISATIGYFGNKTKEEQDEFVAKRSSGAGAASVVTSMFAPSSSGPEVELVRQVAGHTPPETVKAAVKAVQNAPDEEAIAAFRSVHVPALLVAGELDETGRASGMRRVADMMPNAEFSVVANAGHYPWAEQPQAFNELLFDFLDRHAMPATRLARTLS
jgi:3-oxoadipate enol-lactonase